MYIESIPQTILGRSRSPGPNDIGSIYVHPNNQPSSPSPLKSRIQNGQTEENKETHLLHPSKNDPIPLNLLRISRDQLSIFLEGNHSGMFRVVIRRDEIDSELSLPSPSVYSRSEGRREVAPGKKGGESWGEGRVREGSWRTWGGTNSRRSCRQIPQGEHGPDRSLHVVISSCSIHYIGMRAYEAMASARNERCPSLCFTEQRKEVNFALLEEMERREGGLTTALTIAVLSAQIVAPTKGKKIISNPVSNLPPSPPTSAER